MLHLLFTGEAGKRMMQLISSVSLGSTTAKAKVPEPAVPEATRRVEGPTLSYYASMEVAFAYIKAQAKQDDVVLLSPAAPSYDQYKNFEERGGKFKALAAAFRK